MTWRFGPEEELRHAFRRVAEEEIEKVRALLSDAGGDRAKAVHQARQGFKRLRALARLARPAIGASFAVENDCWREAGKLLSGSRDKTVLSETLDKVSGSCGGTVSAESTERIRDCVINSGTFASMEDVEGNVGAVLALLQQARKRAAMLPWPDDTATLERGLHESQSRLRKSWKKAHKGPTHETLHRWRKRVKDQAAQLRLLRLALPQPFDALREEEKETAERLGTDHDLWLLADRLSAAVPAELEATRKALLSAIEAWRTRLQREAFKRGERFSSKKPKSFAGPLSEAWEIASVRALPKGPARPKRRRRGPVRATISRAK